MEEEIKENELLAEVIAGIKYTPISTFIVKPLDPVMIKKDVTTMEPTGEKDEEGVEAFDTKTETKEVESNFRRGVVLVLTEGYEGNIIPGNIVVYNKKFAIDFDLFKDSQLIKPYDIVAVER